MKKTIKVGLTLLIFCLLANLSFAQTATTPKFLRATPILEREVKEDINFGDVSTVIMRSLGRTFVIGGYAKVFADGEEKKYLFKPKTYLLKDVLDSIIKAEPLYQWTVNNGIINLVPKKNYSVLETRIANFYLKDATKEEMIEALQEQPEFQAAIKEAKVKHTLVHCCGGICTSTPQRNTIYLGNATVQEILNEIVKLNGRSVWRYSEFNSTWRKETKKFYEIDFIVNSGLDCSAI